MEDKTIKARDEAFTLEPTNIWKVRQKKAYPEATNHIYLGKVLQQYQSHVLMDCFTFHFGKTIDATVHNNVITGMRRVRRIPWSQIEVIHDVVEGFDFINAKIETDDEGTVVFRDKHHECIITKRTDRLK